MGGCFWTIASALVGPVFSSADSCSLPGAMLGWAVWRVAVFSHAVKGWQRWSIRASERGI